MDCCNYPEYRAQYAWECAGGYAPYAPLQYGYAPPCYAPHAHDPYARYGPTAAAAVGAGAYHYDYRAHHLGALPPDHGLPMDYGAYASKESRARRGLGRRETRRAQPHHLPLPPTPPLECGMGTRGAAYCDPHIWPPYQLGAMSAAGWSGVPSSAWGSRGREQSRRTFGFPSIKGPQLIQNQMCPPEGRSTPYRVYEGSTFSASPVGAAGMALAANTNGMRCVGSESAGGLTCERPRRIEAPRPEVARADPPDEKRAAAVVPLPAFQQAFGSTEIGRFAEAFSRAEAALEEAGATSDAFAFEAFGEWETSAETWSPPPPPTAAPREIKCEDPY